MLNNKLKIDETELDIDIDIDAEDIKNDAEIDNYLYDSFER